MNSPFSFTSRYILDKTHFSECFDESVTIDKSPRAYYKAIGFILVGTALLLTGTNAYASLFLVGLGALEALSVKFKKTWWLWRQMMSKAASNEVKLTIDEQGISSESIYVNSSILWSEITELTVTNRGFLIKNSKGMNYISKRSLDAAAIEFIKSKA
ncbi:YcxB family protein [Shewanella atlantica]|uniref:YcxB family protein n=1 Tax=Shewanella atlantica TaxID=271099 RepID=A0A3S0IZP3_9GAMM|nr:YcxB family protein [Shewanella atlantica]RTR34850.1 YcxB family protein [Shewanella atlantica]